MSARIVRADQRHFSDFGWVKTYWLFSFSDYQDPANVRFGALRVFNDDVVAPGAGFPAHPHDEMEIITIVLDGEITHEDSMGDKTVVRANDVQRMSAGTGLTHSELNLADKPVHLYQVWIYPDTKGLAPSYDQASFVPESWKNRLCPLASGQDIPDTVSFHADATIYRGMLDAGRAAGFITDSKRSTFVYVTTGALQIDSHVVRAGDQARIDPGRDLSLKAVEAADFMLIDVPSGRGYGRKTSKGVSEKGQGGAESAE